jgi:hypothetical protein
MNQVPSLARLRDAPTMSAGLGIQVSACDGRSTVTVGAPCWRERLHHRRVCHRRHLGLNARQIGIEASRERRVLRPDVSDVVTQRRSELRETVQA